MKKYSTWGEEDSEHPNCLVVGIEQPTFANGELDTESSKFYYTFVAESWEAAMAEFNRREYE
jgi:hypothetical protein